MSRIRTIKPEFPQSETIGRLSRDARLLFVQLWTLADDAGRMRGASRMLASLLYPYDDDANKLIEGWLTELDAKNCIRRYEVDGAQYIEIINWLKHQKIDRPSASRIPPFIEGSTKLREETRVSDADLGPGTWDLGPRTASLAPLDQDILFSGGLAPKKPVAVEEPAKKKRTKRSADPSIIASFERFMEAYPKRVGDNPREPALQKFLKAIDAGADQEAIISAASAFATACRKNGADLKFIPYARTWLEEKRWQDYDASSQTQQREMIFVEYGTPEWERAYALAVIKPPKNQYFTVNNESKRGCYFFADEINEPGPPANLIFVERDTPRLDLTSDGKNQALSDLGVAAATPVSIAA